MSRMNKEQMKDALAKFAQSPSKAQMEKMLEESRVDLSQDNRRFINNFFIDADGDLVWKKKNGSYYAIEAERLQEPDWIEHMLHKMDYDLFGEFVVAYMKALRIRGIDKLEIEISDLSEFLIHDHRP